MPIDRIVLTASPGAAEEGLLLRAFKLIRAVRLVRLARIARLVTQSGIVDRVETGLGLHPAVFKVLKLFLLMFFFAHLFACGLYGGSDCASSADSASLASVSPGALCWVDKYCQSDGACLDERDPYMHYLASLYYSFAIMTTIG